MLPTWNSRKKQEARSATIIEPYRALFGERMAADKQYWTLAGQCTRSSGKRLNGCEILQMVEEGLIEEKQFHGVEKEARIHVMNSVAFPGANWYHGDLYEVLARAAAASPSFNPGVLNVDLTCTPDGLYGVQYTSRILALLSDTVRSRLLVTINMALRVRYYQRKGDYVLKKFDECPPFQYAMERRNWNVSPHYFRYEGSADHDLTIMGSFHFVLR